MDFIHKTSRLPYKGMDPTTIVGKSDDLALVEAMKKKYNLEKKKRGYSISNIKDKGVCIATHLLAGKVMRKFHSNEVIVLIVELAK